MKSESTNIVLERFLQIEDDLNLFDKKIYEMYFWMYIRFDLLSDINIMINKINVSQNSTLIGHTKKEKIKNIFMMFLNVIKYVVKFPFLDVKDIIIINHPRKSKNDNGKYECIYTHIISNKLENNMTIEFPYPFKHYYPANKDKIFYMDFIRIITCLLNKIYSKFHLKSDIKKNEDLLNTIFDTIDKEYSIKLNRELYYRKIIVKYYKYKFEKKLLKKFLKKVNPKKILEVVSYNFDNLIINELANELGIETIELQHGIMGANHCAYNFKNKRKLKQFPNKIFTFSKYWNDTTRFPIEDDKVIAVGFPYFEEKLKNKPTIRDKKKVISIIFISQTSIGEYLVKLAVDLNKIINEKHMKDKYEIIYKLHPGEFDIWKEQYKDLVNASIKVISNEIDLYELFRNNDIQVGAYSTAIYEGMGYKLDTYIYKIYGTGMFEELCKKGYAQYVINAKDLFNKIELNLQENKIKSKINFWEENSLNNIMKELKG